MELPSDTLTLYDTAGECFGALHIAPADNGRGYDGIFVVAATNPEQNARSEVRWLCKRHYRRWSEHKVTLDDEGVLTVRKAGFQVVFEPMEGGGFHTVPPAPSVTAFWE